MTVLLPDNLPVTLAEAKAHLRITHHESDSEVAGNLIAATEYVENRSNVFLRAVDVSLTYSCFPAHGQPFYLERVPVNSVKSIDYFDTSGSPQSMDVASETTLVLNQVNQGAVWPISGTQWPTAEKRPDAVTLVYNAGYTDPDNVPEMGKQAIKLMTAHYYDNRHPVAVTGARSTPTEIPLSAVSLIRSLKPGFYADP